MHLKQNLKLKEIHLYWNHSLCDLAVDAVVGPGESAVSDQAETDL